MKEKIKIIYLMLGIPFFILAIIALAIWVSKQINWEFFTFDQKECIFEYLDFNYGNSYIRNLLNKEVEEISQIWNLDKEEILATKEKEKISYEEYSKGVEECVAKLSEKEKIRGRYLVHGECNEQAEKIYHFTSVRDLTKNKKPTLTNSLLKKLRSGKICSRPSLLE